MHPPSTRAPLPPLVSNGSALGDVGVALALARIRLLEVALLEDRLYHFFLLGGAELVLELRVGGGVEDALVALPGGSESALDLFELLAWTR